MIKSAPYNGLFLFSQWQNILRPIHGQQRGNKPFRRGNLPRRSVSSGCAATGGCAGGAARFPACKGGHHFPGILGFAGRTGGLKLFTAGPEQDFKFILAFLALEFIDRHIHISIVFLKTNLGKAWSNVKKCQKEFTLTSPSDSGNEMTL
jgi:hypothetical protein